MTETSDVARVVDGPAAHALRLPTGWSGYEVPLDFPLRQGPPRDELMAALWSVAEQLFTPAEAQPTAWLLMDDLHKDGAVLHLSRNARDWKPRYGLGLWPDQPPPRMTTPNDILDMEWGGKPRLPYHRVTWLGASGSMLKSAWNTMFGVGSTTLTLASGGGEQITRQTRELLRQPITDESFREFPFYFPLLGKTATGKATAAEMDGWLGPTVLYLRESEEDRAVLLLVRTPPRALREAMRGAGFQLPEASER